MHQSPEGQRPMSQEEKLAEARRQVAAIKGFFLHFFVFGVVTLGLAIINAATGGRWWVQWVLLGWGIGVIAHGLFVFMGRSSYIADWERRKIKELADRM